MGAIATVTAAVADLLGATAVTDQLAATARAASIINMIVLLLILANVWVFVLYTYSSFHYTTQSDMI